METFKENIKDFQGSVKERLKSPFILTFCVVWLIHHWELVYLMLNFGADYTAFQKLSFVKVELLKESWWTLFFCPFLCSIVSYPLFLAVKFFYEYCYAIFVNRGRAQIHLWSKDPKVIDIDKYKQIERDLKDKVETINSMNEQMNELQLFQSTYRDYKTDLLKPIAYLMYKSHFNANTVKYYHPRTVYVVPKFLEAIWRLNINDSPSFFQSGNGRLDFTIKGNELMNLDNSVLGTIKDISYEKNNRFLSFKLDGSNSDANYSYFLFVINENEMMGFRKSLELSPLSPTEEVVTGINFVYFEKINP